MLLSSQKPSLTDLVARRQPNHSSYHYKLTKDDSGVSSGFAGFCSAARMQSNASARVRRACYYVMSLPPAAAAAAAGYSAAAVHCDALRHIVGDDPVVLAALGPIAAITTPDIAVLRVFLEEVHHTGAPMPCIRSFRDAMAGGSATWSTVLRLYLAAYSRSPRDLCAHALSLAATLNYYQAQQHNSIIIAPETEKMISAYVAEHPIALGELLSALTCDTDENG